jgi:hypothetical protein
MDGRVEIYTNLKSDPVVYLKEPAVWGPHSTRHRRLHSRKPPTFIDKNGQVARFR